MSELVQVTKLEGVLVAAVDNPPVNALSPGVPEAIAAAVEAAAADPEVHAMIILGAGRTFVAGADIRIFPRIVAGELKLNLNEILAGIENCAKPIIAAIHGTAFGGGLELAMACHYRVAVPSAVVGQPEVKLGLIPGAGGTQRLPRLAGVEKAMEICAFGEPLTAAQALEAGIVDQVVEGDLLTAALAFANQHPPARRTRDLAARLVDAPAAESLAALFKETARKRARGQVAPLAAIDAIAATARLGFEDGIENERRLFAEVLFGPQSKAMIHVFFGERIVAKIPDLPKDTQPLPIERAAVVGAGTMGGGIAMSLINAGIPVLLKETTQSALDHGMAVIRRNYESSVSKGKLSAGQMAERLALLTPTLSYDGFEDAGVVIEAVWEEMALKQHVFRDLDQVMRPGAVLATNTSSLDIDKIAAVTSRPEWVVGMHFFSPANVMKLLEVVRGAQTSPQVIATAMELGRRMKKVGVLAGNCFGFIGNRMFAPYRQQAVELVEEGATAEQVDRVLTEWGMALGPLAVGDLAGIDVGWRVRQAALEAGVPHIEPSSFEDVLYAQGRYGQKTRAGWYLYDDKRKPSSDPEVERLVREYAAVQGIPQRRVSDGEILERVLYALINEGARLLEEGIALRSVDIDIVYVHGYGFPSWRGGPMHYAGAAGLANVLETVTRLYDERGPFWKPAPLLVQLAQEGKTCEQWSR